MINFCHIVPTSHLPLVKDYPVHLLLAHLVEDDKAYRDFYINLKKENPNVFYHMDCSTFELFKQGRPMYESSKLVEMGKLVGADSIVMSDYPKEVSQKTVDAAKVLAPQFKQEGFKTFFCPQSELGDINGLMSSFEWALSNKDVDYIGVSILACPIGLGVNESKHGIGFRDEAYRMQRYLSRWAIFQEMKSRGMLRGVQKRFHCLGMTDGPREIELLREFHDTIFSWDSSSSVWHGINGKRYDNSPTGLRNGKFEKEVDFDVPMTIDAECLNAINYNMTSIDKMCRGEQ